jgi:predicted metal-dependent enzyme (double-stranded beta helix superfamily)
MSLMQQRSDAVEQTLAKVRRIEAELGVSRATLDALKPVLIDLAGQTELFPPEHFPVAPGGHGKVYRLAEDADRRFALYASAGVPGKAQPPHNHTTWAVISGVFGDEHNVFYERIDNRDAPGIGRIRQTGELTVRKGNACAFLPDDFHTIEVTGGKPSLHLHLYGMSLENLPERIFFKTAEGGAYTVFGAPPNIACPLLPAAELKAMLSDGEELALLDMREEGDAHRAVRRGRRPRASRRRQADALWISQLGRAGGRRARLGRGGLRAVQRRPCAEQGVRRVRRARR